MTVRNQLFMGGAALSIGDGELADTSDTMVTVPETFASWLQTA